MFLFSLNVHNKFMKIRLGYACISKTLEVTPSALLTYTEYLKNPDVNRINKIIIKNLENLEKIIDYNKCNEIYFLRLTSKLIPLATKEDVHFNYIKNFKNYYERIAIKLNGMRVDFHPDQFTVLNSVKKEVIASSIKTLEYHYKLLDALDIENKIMIIHIGSSVFGKKASITRFVNVFNNLPKHLKDSLAIENDDKVYNVNDTLLLCEKIGVPMILDYHHYLCNNDGEDIKDFLPRIYKTWQNKNINPKMHFSSPKSKLKKEYRSHHDYIDPLEFIKFINILKKFNQDVDIMLEAKAKDEALFRLIRLLKYYKINIVNNDICF